MRAGSKLCPHCLHVLDRAAWQQYDAGRLGADARGGGGALEEPPVRSLPVTGSGLGGGAFGALNGGLRLVGALLLQRGGRRPRKPRV